VFVRCDVVMDVGTRSGTSSPYAMQIYTPADRRSRISWANTCGFDTLVGPAVQGQSHCLDPDDSLTIQSACSVIISESENAVARERVEEESKA